jgi:hypothetical protein
VLDDLPIGADLEDVDAGHVEGLVLGVDGDEVALGDDPVDLDVDRTDRAEEGLDRVEPIANRPLLRA